MNIEKTIKDLQSLAEALDNHEKVEEFIRMFNELKEENKNLKEELDQAYDFIDRYVYHRERIKYKDISDEEIEDIKFKLRKKLRDDLHSIGAFLPK